MSRYDKVMENVKKMQEGTFKDIEIEIPKSVPIPTKNKEETPWLLPAIFVEIILAATIIYSIIKDRKSKKLKGIEKTKQKLWGKNKRMIYALLLILLLYVFSAGQYLGNEGTHDSANFLALFDLVVISTVMMIVPLILRIKNNSMFDFEKGKKICMYNSLIMFGLSIISIIILGGMYFIGGLGSLLYYFINMFIFSLPKSYSNDTQTVKENENARYYEMYKPENKKIENTVKNETYKNNIANDNTVKSGQIIKKYCTNCGNEIEQGWSFCNYCGEKIIMGKEK